MLCEDCIKLPVARGIKQNKCRSCGHEDFTNINYRSELCARCSDMHDICRYCGKDEDFEHMRCEYCDIGDDSFGKEICYCMVIYKHNGMYYLCDEDLEKKARIVACPICGRRLI